MSKKIKILIIIAMTIALFVWWAVMAATHTKFHMINYWWQAGLSIQAIVVGIFGMMAAKHWSWLKSGVGQGVFFIALGMLMWGIGQAGWTYFVIKDPAQQSPPTHILDILYSSSIPLWLYGMLRLSKATGAKYGLRSLGAKLGVVALIAVMFAVSYYFLVIVARGGNSYFHSDTVLNIIFDLGYAAGDAVNFTLALAIFGLSWKYLGGMFKRPILLVLFGFAVIYWGDFIFSFYDGKGEYYNGHWSDLLYVAMIAIFGSGLCLLDASGIRKGVAITAQGTTPVPPTPEALAPAPETPPQPVTAPAEPVVQEQPASATPAAPGVPAAEPQPAAPAPTNEEVH